MRVLICDDEPLIAATVAEHLALCGYATAVYAQVRDLLIALEHGVDDVGLVLSDLCMPGRDGLRLAEAVRRIVPGLPVVLMTSHPLPYDNADLHARGISAVLRKPLRMHEVEAVAASAAGRSNNA